MLKHPAIRAAFREAFPVDNPRLEGRLLAPPISKRASPVGTAFDYLLRFRLERSFSSCIADTWVAENAVERLNAGVVECDDATLSDANTRLASARAAHRRYMNTGKIGSALIRAAVDLAQLDAIYRTGRTYGFYNADADDLGDLRGILGVAKSSFVMPSQTCYLNPNFGDASSLVGGADADLVIDGALIDIKTTKTLSFGQEMYNQLVGYCILSRLGKLNGRDKVDLSSVAVYFARYGVLHTIPISGIEKALDRKFMSFFEKAATSMFHA